MEPFPIEPSTACACAAEISNSAASVTPGDAGSSATAEMTARTAPNVAGERILISLDLNDVPPLYQWPHACTFLFEGARVV